MDISAVNFNFNAINRAGFSGAADGTEGPVHATVRSRRGRTGISTESQLTLLPPAHAPDEAPAVEGSPERGKRDPGHNVNLTV